MIRLLLPFSIPSPLSIYSWIPNINTTSERDVKENDDLKTAEIAEISKTTEAVTKEVNTKESHYYADSSEKFETFPLNEAVRFAGVVIVIIIFLFLYIRSLMEFRTSLPVNNEFIKEWLGGHKLKRKISIRYSDRISTPLSYGLFKPVILLPKNMDLGDSELLNYILTHEYVHIRRFDILTKTFLIAALCVHWFNPAVWIMFILFNRDIELSCDEAVVRSFGEKSKAAYAYALIDMEARKQMLMPLCSNFSKNAVKERITSVMKIKKTSLIMILFAVIFVFGTATVFMTSAKENERESTSRIDYKKIDDLKFKDYEKMSVSEYSDKVLKAVDSKEYAEALKKIANNKEFYEKRNIDEEAWFYNYILAPMMARNWKYGVISDAIRINNVPYLVEYAIHVEMLNPKKLTVGEYKTAMESIKSGVNSLKKELVKNEVKDAKEISEKFRTGLIKISEKISNDNLKITLEGVSETESDRKESEVAEINNEKREEGEKRRIEYATREDYDDLFSHMKKKGYEKRSLEDFNNSLSKWAFEKNIMSSDVAFRYDRINEDINYDDFKAKLTEEEKEFLKTTIFLSGLENAEKFKALHIGEKEHLPSISIGFSEDTKIGNGRYESYDCSYQFSYNIPEKNKITVAERDSAVREFMAAAGKIWSSKEFSDLSKVDKSDIVKELTKIANEHSSNKIVFKILEDQIVFDKINENRE